jgi:hypothetical protein
MLAGKTMNVTVTSEHTTKRACRSTVREIYQRIAR